MVFPEQQHPDLHASLSLPGASDPLAPNPLLLGNTARARTLRSHGVAAAGIIAATGDNEKGVAGMVWDADLRLFAFGRGTSLPKFPVPRLDSILKAAARTGVRVISSSTGFGRAADTRTVRAIRIALAAYLTTGPGNLLVVAAGQAEPRTGPGLRVPLRPAFPMRNAFDRAAAQLIDTFPKQILLVVGVDAQGAFWAPSDFYTGDTLIAAPATDIMTLAAEADFPEGTFVPTGNSYAAPFVAGVAAQLLAMRPALTGAEVGAYILRDSVINVGTGRLESRPTVPLPPGATGRLYLLDAYGALSLLSRERSDTPICGFPVAVDGFDGIMVRPEAPGRAPLPVAGASAVLAVSVAQGGRLMAVVAPTAGSGPVRLLDHHGHALGTLPNTILERRYLERDTLDVSLQSRMTPCGLKTATVLTRRGPSGTSRLEPIARVAPTGLELLSEFATRVTAASPVGDQVVIAGRYAFGPSCEDSAATVQNRMDVMPFDSTASVMNVFNCGFGSGGEEECPIGDQPGAWSHDGQRVLLPLIRFLVTDLLVTGVNTQLVRFLGLTSRDTIRIPGRGLLHPGFSADDSVAFFAEFDQVDQFGNPTSCLLTRRRATDAMLLTPGDPAALALCEFGGPGPGRIFNVRSRLAATGAQPADAAGVARGKQSPLARRTVPSAYVAGPRRVQAN